MTLQKFLGNRVAEVYFVRGVRLQGRRSRRGECGRGKNACWIEPKNVVMKIGNPGAPRRYSSPGKTFPFKRLDSPLSFLHAIFVAYFVRQAFCNLAFLRTHTRIGVAAA